MWLLSAPKNVSYSKNHSMTSISLHYLLQSVSKPCLIEVADTELEVLGKVEERKVEGFGEEARGRAAMEHAESQQAAHLIVPVLSHSCRNNQSFN